MGRPTKLDRCCKCEHEARAGVFLSYYFIKSKRKSGVSKPIKGDSFPAIGYCIDHFLELAKKKGMLREERQELREKLDGRSASRGRRK